MVVLAYVLRRLSAENERSAIALDTGIVCRRRTNLTTSV